MPRVLVLLLLSAGTAFVLLMPALDGAPAPLPRNRKTVVNSVGMKLMLVPRGKFMMGSPDTERGRTANERQHEVEISQPFYMGAFEVTQEQYRKVMGSNPSGFAPTGKLAHLVRGLDTRNFPVETVSWHDAIAFCKKLSALPAEKSERRTYRLPSEAEWEYACRGGAKEYSPWGLGKTLTAADARINGRGAPGGDRPTTVGSYKRPNGFGLHDMHGNVWEWVNDWRDDNYYAVSPKVDPQGPASGTYRVLRGGTWASSPTECRSAYRAMNPPGERNEYCGFRAACTVGR
jgi:formylglycine-generating enzyme required for sulfatase activity